MDEEVRCRKPYNRVGLDAAILMNPQTWVTYRPCVSFSDPLLDCRACKSRHRADKLISECEQGKGVDVDAMTFDEMDAFIAYPPEGRLPRLRQAWLGTPIRTVQPDVPRPPSQRYRDSSSTCYLRETAQGIFVGCEHPAHDPPQAALRRLPGRQGVPQLNHAAAHLPHPRLRADGVRSSQAAPIWVVSPAGGLLQHWWRASAFGRKPAPARPRACRAQLLQPRHHRHQYAFPFG